MDGRSPATLIVGCDGRVGGALMTSLERSGRRVVGTTRRNVAYDESRIHLDLSEDLRNRKFPWPVSTAVICAGVTNIAACEREPEKSARVNVAGITGLIENLVESGAFVIYLSSNLVFDGSVSYRLPTDSPCPVTEHGRHRAKVESKISHFGESISIVRFSKVLGPIEPLFASWTESLKKKETIQPFSDLNMAPVPVSSAVSILRLMIEQHIPGIFHLSGARDISYADAARIGAAAIGADESLITPISGTDAGLEPKQLPRYATLNIERLKLFFGIQPPDVDWTIRTAFANPGALGAETAKHRS